MAKKKVKKKVPGDAKGPTFEQSLEKLEEVVARLESGELGLDDSLSQYELGVKYLRVCYRQLAQVQQKIELLSGVDEQGVVKGEPFGEAEMTLEEKQASRGRRRTRSASDDLPESGMDELGTLF